MKNIEKYTNVFTNMFGVTEETAKLLKYQSIEGWDSIGHMALIAELEEAFGIMMETDDIIDFSSYQIGIEILGKYNVEF